MAKQRAIPVINCTRLEWQGPIDAGCVRLRSKSNSTLEHIEVTPFHAPLLIITASNSYDRGQQMGDI